MNAEEFAAYVERAIPEFAQDKVASGQWSKASSLELSRQGYDELLPKGLATPENFLFTLRETATQATVGALWLRISANVTGDFGNVTGLEPVLGCAGKIVGMVVV